MRNKKVTVIGLGNSGLNAAMLLKDLGAQVRLTEANDNNDIGVNAKLLESRNIPYEIGGHTKDYIIGSELIIVSPGVEASSLSIKWANELGIPIMSEMELGYKFCKGRIMGITGTNGKSTVTTLIGQILKNGGLDTVVCGNIGNSLCGEIKMIKKDTWVVLEVSSFQLERITNFRPHIAVILNITDDHLDRYIRFSDYFNEKLKIFRNQTEKDTLILNRDAEGLKGLDDLTRSRVLYYSRLSKTNGAYLKGNRIACLKDGQEFEVCSTEEIPLKGLHNIENVLVSSLAGILADISPASIRSAIRKFKGLCHRFETVDMINGVEYIDDSKGTTVDSTFRALQSCKKPVILIAGGKDKNSDYSVIKGLVRDKVKYLILIGEAKKRIRDAVGNDVETYEANTMDDAVKLSNKLAKENYAVLLSPMCSSFDMFRDYKERGELFKKAVSRLK